MTGRHAPGGHGRMGAAALRYAEHGWPVVPLHTPTAVDVCSCPHGPDCGSPGKHPRTRTGLAEATTDLEVVDGWWRRWPDANIGVATGEVSGLVALDVDLPHGPRSLERLEQTVGPVPATCTQRTGSGGSQLLFAHPGGQVRNRVAVRPGLDVRGDGGYIVVPPSLHASGDRYVWTLAEPVRPIPGPLLEMLTRADRRHLQLAGDGPTDGPVIGRPTAYGGAALDGEIAMLARAVPGTRNDTLNRAAFRLGQLVADGALQPDHVAHCLRGVALDIGLGELEVDRTIASGLAAGARSPRGTTAGDVVSETVTRGGAVASVTPLMRGPRMRSRS